ncbi:hypothetical protein H9657_09735 [Cellulomonas sp. Sa3CUA2]|uniref:Periplasmic copper-binding protein NosD beta helix domain-containing protein n=1 Tax=Cellulomonas avistercoris TaxID=2762242 RepID=A0ABR8QDR1_9CELL|nr:right-handed parallel beta-helix repeat-containing protein [Cellulomonas avistercoris]MBD7918553.1 hypothetical protein [Cellulomonas avistercoris]
MLCSALVAGSVVLAVPAVAAPAPAVRCGDVVAGAVVLTADLVCRGSAVGLTLLDGASLDLGGHRIVGGGTGTGVTIPGQGTVTIRNGVVTAWAQGAAVAPGDDMTAGPGVATLDDLTFRGNDVGLSSIGLGGVTPEIEVTATRFVDNRAGVSGLASRPVTLTSSRLVDNDVAASFSSGIVTVVDSVIAHNRTGLACDEAACDVADSTLRDNGTAVSATWYGTATMHRNTVTRNDVGLDSFWVPSVPNELVENTFSDNGTAVRLVSALGTLTGNTFVRNDVGFEGRSDDGPPDFTASLVDNEFRRNGDGILSVVGESTLQGNTAVRNERWGIHAPGAVDLGGNTARGNGNEPQCVGVVCGGPGPAS